VNVDIILFSLILWHVLKQFFVIVQFGWISLINAKEIMDIIMLQCKVMT